MPLTWTTATEAANTTPNMNFMVDETKSLTYATACRDRPDVYAHQ